jgi:hypothetical protein
MEALGCENDEEMEDAVDIGVLRCGKSTLLHIRITVASRILVASLMNECSCFARTVSHFIFRSCRNDVSHPHNISTVSATFSSLLLARAIPVLHHRWVQIILFVMS